MQSYIWNLLISSLGKFFTLMVVKTLVSGKQAKLNEYAIIEGVPKVMKMARGILFSITQNNQLESSWTTKQAAHLRIFSE